MLGALQPATHTGLSVPLADVQLSHQPENSRHRPKLAPKDFTFQDIQVEGDHFVVSHLLISPYFSHFCIVSSSLRSDTEKKDSHTPVTSTVRQSSALTWIHTDEQ